MSDQQRTFVLAPRGILCILLLAGVAGMSMPFLPDLFLSGKSLRADDPKSPAGLLDYLATMNKSVRPVEETIFSAMQKGDLAAAEKLCRKLIDDVPFAPSGYYNLACVLALRGEREEAFAALTKAVDRGFGRMEQMQQDPDLATLRDDRRFADLLRLAAESPTPFPRTQLQPYAIVDQTAWVRNENTVYTGEKLFRVAFRHAVPNAEKIPVTKLGGKVGEWLTAWQAEGTIAGNVGDLYDNRDGDHSDLDRKLFPQLTWVEYAEPAKVAQLHWGLQDRLHLDGVVIGNASVARTQGPFWRSMPRLATENQQSAEILHRQYRENKMYFYPGHVDHSPGRDGQHNGQPGGHGDVFPANTPYLIASQGSSGSDQVFLQAVAATLAAFRPATKAALVKEGLLMPAVQMIFRSSNAMVETPDDYLTGKAHPTVFSGSRLRPERMVKMAHDMTSDVLPPLAQLKVVLQDEPLPGRDFFDPHDNERLFDTPCAIARVFRGVQYRRKLVLDATASFDCRERPLTFHWVVLRGPAEGIAIRPLDERRARVEIEVPWTPRRPIQPQSELESNRIDIALFVHNGTYHSPPAFLTFYSLDNEEREYDDQQRIRSVVYTGAMEPGHYTDPLVALPKSWRDEYHYSAAGKMTGWTRTRPGTAEGPQEFNALGERIVQKEEAGKPLRTTPVRYLIRPRSPRETPVIVESPIAGP